MAVSNKGLGLGLYKDDKDRTIYYDKFSKKAYIISKKDEKKFYLFSARPALAFVAGYIGYYLTENWIITIFVGIVTYLLLLFFFKKMFLVDLGEIKGFVPNDSESLAEKTARSFTTGRIISIIVVSFALSGLSLFNIFYSNYTGIIKYLNYALSLGAAIFGLFYIYVLTVKNKK